MKTQFQTPLPGGNRARGGFLIHSITQNLNKDHVIRHSLKIFTDLIKIKITAAVSITTAVGYLLAVEELSLEIFNPIIGIFLLASGSAALNQYQEKDTDGMMSRTSKRPLPANRIRPGIALFIIIVLAVAGLVILYLGTNLQATLLGILALVWYNGVYTPLKRKTAFAAIPGALIGAIPPLVGWIAAGGYIFDPQIILMAGFFFIWQVPHFWLLLLMAGDEYKEAGLPSLTNLFSIKQISRLTFIWMLAAAISCLSITSSGMINYFAIKIALFSVALWMAWNAANVLNLKNEKTKFKFVYVQINIAALLVAGLLSVDKLLHVNVI